jgi:hypothetical protein
MDAGFSYKMFGKIKGALCSFWLNVNNVLDEVYLWV